MVSDMIEKAIEIEGLLRIVRDRKPQPETYKLLKEKVAELSKGIKEITEAAENADENSAQVDIVMAIPEESRNVGEVAFTAEEEKHVEKADDAEEEMELTEEDDILLTFDEGLDATVAPHAESEEIKKETNPKQSVPAKRNVKLKSAFSLNDRFLYARELFDGNMKMFDSTLEFIEGIDDYSIIEDYFYSELEWDPENSYVASFMEILRPRFRE